MIAKARELHTSAEFEVLDLRLWRADRPVDVLVSNAVLHWVPEHPELLPAWVESLAPEGVLAFQVPGNFHEPSHTLIRGLCRTAWRHRLGDLAREDAPVLSPGGYLAVLADLGCEVDAWETTYVHVLRGEDAVVRWLSGTTLRPMLGRLEGEERTRFLADCARVLGEAYPARPYGTPFRFRRVFVVARRTSL
ncbi:hypothetical protein Ssi02_35110 [Sinosporangium siamense]|uniref:Trans-aconitate 2-methyltransferase n=2 Tax=Sinosporangium siamense TaxID=1367973 RepID=A0A919RG56_9ACTN|nr:hypothetical protein Ssi02_35110 [Sinosporangium siamense]